MVPLRNSRIPVNPVGLKSTETIARSTGFILTQDSTSEMTYDNIFPTAVRQRCRESEFVDVLV